MLVRLVVLLFLVEIASSFLATYYRYDSDLPSPQAAQPVEDDAAELEDRTWVTSVFNRHRRDHRVCGTQLLASLKKICGGCVQPANDEVVSKRSEFWAAPSKRSLVDNCCKNRCSMEYMKKFCC